jgi:hypothetical protein
MNPGPTTPGRHLRFRRRRPLHPAPHPRAAAARTPDLRGRFRLRALRRQAEDVVAERSLAIARFLVANGAKALVVACNTATVAAVKLLRARFPDMPIVGVEPGLKPAAAASRNGKVGVLATERTLAGAKFLQLRDQIARPPARSSCCSPAVGLVDQIELANSIRQACDRHAEALRRAAAGARRRYPGARLHPLSAGAGLDRTGDRCASTAART